MVYTETVLQDLHYFNRRNSRERNIREFRKFQTYSRKFISRNTELNPTRESLSTGKFSIISLQKLQFKDYNPSLLLCYKKLRAYLILVMLLSFRFRKNVIVGYYQYIYCEKLVFQKRKFGYSQKVISENSSLQAFRQSLSTRNLNISRIFGLPKVSLPKVSPIKVSRLFCEKENWFKVKRHQENVLQQKIKFLGIFRSAIFAI